MLGLTFLSLWLVTSPADSAAPAIQQLPNHYLEVVDNKTLRIDTGLSRSSVRYLRRLSNLEAKLLHQLRSIDSTGNVHIPPVNYNQWATSLQNSTPPTGLGTTYVPGLDTLSTTLRYLAGQQSSAELSKVDGDVQMLQGKVDANTLVQQYISQRRQQLTNLLSRYSHLPPDVTQTFTQYKETAYYYRQQVEQYKAMLNDPGKMEKEAVTILSKIPSYQTFLAKNSLLATLFRLPSAYDDGASLQGMQTRSQVQDLLQQQIGGGGQAVQGQLQAAQNQITGMQNALSKYGVGGQDLDMPNFKPNTQKTKTFFNRLEYGANIQFAKAAYDFPTTANIAATAGYKINDKSTIGLGLAYAEGIGSDWSHIAFTSQSIGLRSFIDWKIKRTWYVTGGYEVNYMTQFTHISQLRDISAWQPSALIGLEKKYQISSKLQGNIQLLFDALYKQEIPQGQAIRFRVGYNF